MAVLTSISDVNISRASQLDVRYETCRVDCHSLQKATHAPGIALLTKQRDVTDKHLFQISVQPTASVTRGQREDYGSRTAGNVVNSSVINPSTRRGM